MAAIAIGVRIEELHWRGTSFAFGGFATVPLGLALLLESSPRRAILLRVAEIAGGLTLAVLGAVAPEPDPLLFWEEPARPENRLLLVVGGIGLVALAFVTGFVPRQGDPPPPAPRPPRGRAWDLLALHRTALILAVTAVALLTAVWAAAVALATEARLADRSLLEVNCRWQDGSVITLATIDGERAGRARFLNNRPPSPPLRPLARQLVLLGTAYGAIPREYVAWAERF